MKRIVVMPFKDGNVKEGMRRLIQLNKDAVVMFPVMDLPQFTTSMTQVLEETSAKYHLFFTDGSDGIDNLVLKAHDITMCLSPMKEMTREITAEDVLAMVWEDSIEAHLVLHAVEDLAIEAWNIDDGLEPIEVEFDDDDESDMLYEEMQEALSVFIEAFATYITNGVLNTLAKAVEERLREDLGKKDIDPFEK
jgi:hypothetical protein